MLDFGFDKIALIGAVALIVIGPEKLPKVARTMGHLFGKAQRYVADVKAEVNRSIELDELKKMKTEFEDAARNVEQTVRSEVQQAGSVLEQRMARDQGGVRWQRAGAGLRTTPAELPPPEEELAPEARRHAAVVQAAARRALAGPVGRGAGGALQATGPEVQTMSGAKEDHDELEGTEAPFVSHLIELRDRLIRAVIAIGIAFAVLCVWPGPSRMYDLLAAPLLSHLPQGTKLIATSVISPILVPFKITLMAALLVALPVRALPGLGLRRARGSIRTRRSWCCRWWCPAPSCSSWASRSATFS